MKGTRPRFQLLDIVVASPPESGWRFSGRGSICQVRQYGDGRFVYVVAPLEDDEEVGAVFDETELQATGERQDPIKATTVGSFRLREVVRVMTTSEHAEVAGLVGVIQGGDEASLLIWIDDLAEVFVVPSADLETTGARRPAMRRPERKSLRVAQTGDVRGRDDYVVLQDLDDI